jgi:hypothetical protein
VSNVKDLQIRVGNLYQSRARYDLALNAYNKSLNIFEKEKDTLAVSELYIDLATLYQKLQDTAKTLQFFERSAAIKAHPAFRRGIERLTLQRALFHCNLDDFRNAQDYLARALQPCDNSCSPYLKLLEIYAWGSYYLARGVLKEADKFFSNAIIQATKINDRFILAESLLSLAVIKIKEGKIPLATKHLEKSLLISKNNEFNETLLKIYDAYIDIHTASQNYSNLADYQSLYIDQKDKIYGEELLVRISTMQAEFETREDVNLIQDQKELMALQEKTLKQKRAINLAIGSVVIMLLIILWILYTINKRKKAFNQNLDRMVHERTRELEEKQIELERMSIELEIEMEGIQKEMQVQLATLQGIYYLAEKENNASEEKMNELRETIGNLRTQLKALKEFRSETSSLWQEEAGQLLE